MENSGYEVFSPSLSFGVCSQNPDVSRSQELNLFAGLAIVAAKSSPTGDRLPTPAHSHPLSLSYIFMPCLDRKTAVI